MLCHPLLFLVAVSMTKYVTFDVQLRAAFVADKIWGFMLEPARRLHPSVIVVVSSTSLLVSRSSAGMAPRKAEILPPSTVEMLQQCFYQRELGRDWPFVRILSTVCFSFPRGTTLFSLYDVVLRVVRRGTTRRTHHIYLNRKDAPYT